MEFYDPYDHNNPYLIYTPENIPTQETEEQFNEEFTLGCECGELCTVENKCTCILKSGSNYLQLREISENPHDSYMIDITDSNKPIYECNAKCKCYSTICGNRLVQFGPRKHLKIISCKLPLDLETAEIHKSTKRMKLNHNPNHSTNSTKGLGLITTANIKQGNFICEYAGEIITKAEANRRHEVNEQQALMNYIFCINEHFGGKNLSTYIDPSKFGNIGRYLNHSCQPNCKLLPIRVNNMIPKLCIFAAQDIEKDCEITFDYGSDSFGHSEVDSDHNKIKCLCGATLCRKYLPFSKY